MADNDSGELKPAGRSDTATWVCDPGQEGHAAALRQSCQICKAKPGHLCRNTINPAAPLPGRLLHFGRIS